jgi:Protein of unknown function (DUF3306)
MTDEPFISRWSRRKSAAKTAVPLEKPPELAENVAPPLPVEAAPAAPEPLPPVESLTPESDFAAFMKPDVDPSLKREAFKKLIEDPRFNVMDGLDVYIDDYSQPDPLPEGWLEKMTQMRYLGIFKEDEKDAEDAEKAAKTEPEALPEAMHEAPLSFPPQPAPADTPGDQTPPPDVGKSGVSREGN